MADILHAFPIKAPVHRVFEVLCSPAGLDAWWTKASAGTPGLDATYRLSFGPGYDWVGVVRRFEPSHAVEWELTDADPDWQGTRVGFVLTATPSGTEVEFAHTGWREPTRHYRISSFCWAMYLRLLKRYIETGDVVEFAERLEV